MSLTPAQIADVGNAMSETRKFFIRSDTDKTDLGSIEITAPTITMAEQDIIILGQDGKAIAILKPMAGFETHE